jgi:hypothetical protein
MEGTDHMAATEQFSAFYQANGQAAQRYTAATIEGAQRLMRVQIDATREVMERNNARWRDAMTRFDPARGPLDWPSLMTEQMQIAMEMTRASMEGAARVYGEYVRTMQEQGRAMTNAFEQTRAQGEAAAADAARETDRASQDVGRRAAEVVSQMSGQAAGSAAAAQSAGTQAAQSAGTQAAQSAGTQAAQSAGAQAAQSAGAQAAQSMEEVQRRRGAKV